MRTKIHFLKKKLQKKGPRKKMQKKSGTAWWDKATLPKLKPTVGFNFGSVAHFLLGGPVFRPTFFAFFLSCVVPALFAAARALASPRLLLGPGSAALTILTLTFSTVCPLTFPLRFLEGQPGARHGRCRARVHHGCFFGRGASPSGVPYL